MKTKVLLIGPQGSGKSTQAELLAEYLNVPKITMGDIFRQIASEGSAAGKRIQEILDQGHLVDDQTTAGLVKQRLETNDAHNGFVMDGYPRTIEQKNLFSPNFDSVIYLNVPKEEVVSRLLQRGRSDDTVELINKRLDLYYQQTQPLLDYYNNQGILTEINGIGDIDQIQHEIRKHL